MRNGRDTVLLTWTRPPLPVPQFPLLFYFFFEDLDALLGTLEDAGLKPVRLGHPPDAPGGEVKATDPDGNTILLASHRATSEKSGPVSRSMAAAAMSAQNRVVWSARVTGRVR